MIRVTRGVILLVALAKFVECLSDVIGGLLQLNERLDQAAISLMIRGGLSIVLFAATFLWSRSLLACTAAMCVAWLAVFLGYDLRRAKEALAAGEPYFRLDWQVERKLVLLALPLGFVTMLLSLNGNLPRYLLEHYGGPAQLGMFASMAYLLVAVSTVVNALGQSATVRLSSLFAAGNLDGFKKLMGKLVRIGFAVLLLGLPLAAIFGRSLLILMYRPEYGDSMGAFLIMVAAGGVERGSLLSRLWHDGRALLPRPGASDRRLYLDHSRGHLSAGAAARIGGRCAGAARLGPGSRAGLRRGATDNHRKGAKSAHRVL